MEIRDALRREQDNMQFLFAIIIGIGAGTVYRLTKGPEYRADVMFIVSFLAGGLVGILT
jgi:Co/Zn/Cd efflux system component